MHCQHFRHPWRSEPYIERHADGSEGTLAELMPVIAAADIVAVQRRCNVRNDECRHALVEQVTRKDGGANAGIGALDSNTAPYQAITTDTRLWIMRGRVMDGAAIVVIGADETIQASADRTLILSRHCARPLRSKSQLIAGDVGGAVRQANIPARAGSGLCKIAG